MTELVTIEEIARTLKVSTKTVRYWRSRNEIPYLKVGRHLRFEPQKVLSHFEKTTEENKPACFQNPALLRILATKRRSLKTSDASHAEQKE